MHKEVRIEEFHVAYLSQKEPVTDLGPRNVSMFFGAFWLHRDYQTNPEEPGQSHQGLIDLAHQ